MGSRKCACPGRLRKFTGPWSREGGLPWHASLAFSPVAGWDWGLQGTEHVDRVSETSFPVMGLREKHSLWTHFPNPH